MTNTQDLLVHDNRWWFGTTQNIIYNKGIGFVEIIYDNTTPDTAYIRRLCVHESARRRGIGTLLLKICEDIAKSKDKTYMMLHADKEDPDLIMWYSAHGYVITDTDEHEHKMVKNIKTT